MANPPQSASGDGWPGVQEFLRQSFVTGTAVTLPLIVSLIVLGVVVNFVSRQLDPVVGVVTSSTGFEPTSEAAIKVVALGILVGAVLLIGAITEYRPGQSEVGMLVEVLIARIPGVGSLYRSLDEMSGLMLDTDTESFREVKLIEFPADGTHAIAFTFGGWPTTTSRCLDSKS